MKTPEIHQLHSDFTAGLRNLVEQRSDESEVNRLERELSNPNTSFFGGLREAAGRVTWFNEGTPGDYYIDSTDDTLEFQEAILSSSVTSAYNTKWSYEIFNYDGSFRDLKRDWQFYQYAALSNARKYLKLDDPPEQMRGLLIAARVASLNLPEDYIGQKPKRHKQEITEAILFRKATTILHEVASRRTNASREFSKFLEKFDEMVPDKNRQDDYYLNIMSQQDTALLRQGQAEMSLRVFAMTVLELLAREQTTPELIHDEQYKLSHLKYLCKGEDQEVQESDTVNWNILPPEALGEIEHTGEIKDKEGKLDFVDPERLKWLARLAIDWGNDAYIVVSSLKEKSDTNKYYAAILPELKNGVPIEHAVAENASSGNATYVFRGERGLNADGSTWLTWKDVLKDTKSGARALGAKKILHGKYWNENVIEYLTRPDTNLDSDRYRR